MKTTTAEPETDRDTRIRRLEEDVVAMAWQLERLREDVHALARGATR